MASLIEDTNQKTDQHTTKNECWCRAGVKVVRCRLPFGDYAFVPPIVVDTKRDVLELAANIKNDHVRFRNAAILAKECGSRLVILVENEDGIRSVEDLAGWLEPENHFHMRRHRLNSTGRNPNAARRWTGQSLAKACVTMNKRYGLEFAFCTPEEAAGRVLELLGGGECDGEPG